MKQIERIKMPDLETYRTGYVKIFFKGLILFSDKIIKWIIQGRSFMQKKGCACPDLFGSFATPFVAFFSKSF